MSNLTTFPDARLPTDSELRARKNVLVQAWRFALLNIKMIAHGHQGPSLTDPALELRDVAEKGSP